MEVTPTDQIPMALEPECLPTLGVILSSRLAHLRWYVMCCFIFVYCYFYLVLFLLLSYAPPSQACLFVTLPPNFFGRSGPSLPLISLVFFFFLSRSGYKSCGNGQVPTKQVVR